MSNPVKLRANLRCENLEGRDCPASITDSQGVLTIVGDANVAHTVQVLDTGGGFVLVGTDLGKAGSTTKRYEHVQAVHIVTQGGGDTIVYAALPNSHNLKENDGRNVHDIFIDASKGNNTVVVNGLNFYTNTNVGILGGAGNNTIAGLFNGAATGTTTNFFVNGGTGTNNISVTSNTGTIAGNLTTAIFGGTGNNNVINDTIVAGAGSTGKLANTIIGGSGTGNAVTMSVTGAGLGTLASSVNAVAGGAAGDAVGNATANVTNNGGFGTFNTI